MSTENERLVPEAGITEDQTETGGLPQEKPVEDSTPESAGEDGEDHSGDTEGRGEPKLTYKTPWRDEVKPYLTKLAKRISRDGVKDTSIALPMGQHRLLVSPREQGLMAAYTGDPDASGIFDGILIDSLGLQVKILASLRSLEKYEGDQADRLKKRLSRDRDHAYLLSRGMTVTMRQLREGGDQKRDGVLRESRSHLQKAIVAADDVVGTDIEEVPQQAKSSQFVYDWNEISSLPKTTPSDRTPPSAGIKRPEPEPKRKDRAVQRRVILAVLGAVLVAVLVNLWLNRERQLRDFGPEDFLQVKGIEQVINRSPTLLIVVDQAQWDQMRRAEKRKAITTIGTAIKSAGYKKVEIRSHMTPNLAVWYRSGAIEVAH